MRKKSILCFLLILSLLLSFTGCQKKDTVLAPVKQGGLWGYCNQKGKIKIQPQFKQAYYFSKNGLALVQIDAGEYAYIGKNGKRINDKTYEFALGYSENGLAPAFDDVTGKFGYIDESGEFAIEGAYLYAYPFVDDLAVVAEEGEDGTPVYQYINEDGEPVIQGDFSAMYPFGSNGLAPADDAHGRRGFLDKKGKWAIEPVYYNSYYSPFSNGYTQIVDEDGNWGYLNGVGDVTIKPQFQLAGEFASNGLAAVQDMDGHYEYINIYGNKVIDCKDRFAQIGKFNDNGLAPVQDKRNGRWGFIDIAGTYVVKPQFKATDARFYQGLCAVQTANGKWGFLDEQGKFAIEPQFREVGSFVNFEELSLDLSTQMYQDFYRTLAGIYAQYQSGLNQ